ncbi:MAG: O-antigen ligase family protein [Thermoleophilia bacterium]
MLTPPSTHAPTSTVLIQLGAALLALGFAVSLAYSPDPLTTLPWAIQGWLGAAAAWVAWNRGGTTGARGRRATGSFSLEIRAARVMRTILVSGYACLALLPTATDWPTYKYPTLARVYGALPSLLPYAPDWASSGISPNQTGGILAAVGASAFCLALPRLPRTPSSARVRRSHPAATLLAVLSTAAVLLSGSRAALVALVVAVLFTLVLRDRRIVWAVAGMAAALFAASVVRPALPEALLTRLLHEEPLQAKLLARVDIWSSALHGIADHPFAGIGLGTLNDVLPIRYPYGSVGLTYSVTQAHNAVLDTALTMGIPGAFGLILLVTGVVWAGVSAGRTQSCASAPMMGLTVAAVVFVIFGVTDALSLASPSSLLLWLLLCGLFYTGYLQESTHDRFDMGTQYLYTSG